MEPSPETRKNTNLTSTTFESQIPHVGIVFGVDMRERLGPHNNSDMLVCRLDDFLKHYRPSDFVLDDDVDRCFEKIVCGGLAGKSGNGGYLWTAPATFDLLKTIIHCVLDFVKKDDKKAGNMHFMLVHHDNAGNSCFIAEPLISPGTKFANEDNNTSTEVKRNLNANKREKLHLRILGACHHIMSEDIRRMWIYGLTFEDNLCSLWYFSRTHSVKTKAFDWFKDPKSLVSVLLAFAKASPCELGIDPSVHLVLEGEDKRISFVYEVPVKKNDANGTKQYYKTLDNISDSRHMSIAGRTTRVWKVVEVTDTSGKQRVESSKEMVLKDVWVSTDRDTEGQNQDAIFAAVDKYVENGLKAQRQKHPAWDDKELLTKLVLEDPQFQSFDQLSVDRLVANLTNKAYRNLFLTKIHDWQGESCKAVGENVWRDPNLFPSYSLMDLPYDSSDLIEDTQIPSKSKDPKCTNRPSTVQHKELDTENIHRSFSTKRQSRFIYGEVCTTLQNLGTVGEVADVLYQTMDAMHILFLAGWVHRDISSSNIMAYRSNPKGPWAVKLADLEFSRLMVDPTRQGNVDPRTGTPYFMPVEVLGRRYLLDNFRISSPSVQVTHPDEFTLSDESNPFDQTCLEITLESIRSSQQAGHAQMNLAVQLNASTRGQDYVDNLKNFKPFPGNATFSDIPAGPRWADVPKEAATVNHNYQHDLESIWWILLWIITSRIDHKTSADVMEDYFEHRMTNVQSRLALLREFMTEKRAELREEIYPIWPALQLLAKIMHKSYLMRAVFGHLEVPEAYSSIQADFSKILRAVQAHKGRWRSIFVKHSSNSQTQTYIAITQDPSTTTGKRPHEATVDDPSEADESAQKRICK